MSTVTAIFAFLLFGANVAMSGHHETCAGDADKAASSTINAATTTSSDGAAHKCSCPADCACRTGEKVCDCGCAGKCDKP